MSRRPNAAADKAAANTAVIKNLLKLPGNKVCADCKRNKLPRWASWNLGIFICIRCSGIHRGMGTHISKVKSVDLDSWTDEQLQSVVKWGNSKANKYWEANLAPGHVPSEAKIENFIRTKYESKRWVMEGGIPDPSTLDDEDDDNVQVQEKLEHRKSAGVSSPQPAPPVVSKSANINLFDDEPISTPVAKAAAPAPVQPAKTPDSASLLGLDFFAPAASPSPRPSSIISDPGSKPAASTGRPDYKSILSLYASAAPRQQVVQPQQSPTMISYGAQQQNFSSLNDSFNSLSFGQTQTATPAIQQQQQLAPAPAKPSPFANLTAGMKKSVAAPQVSKPSPGGFFSPPKTTPAASASSGLGDLFDFGTPAAAPAQPTHSHSASMSSLSGMGSMATTSSNASSNAFANLAFETNAWVTPAPTTTAATTTNNTSNNWGGIGGMGGMGGMGSMGSMGGMANSSLSSTAAWGAPVMTTPAMNAFANTASSAWGASSATATTAPPVASFAPTSPGNVWGSSATTTTAPTATSKPSASTSFGGDDEDWGNFSSGTTVQSTPAPVKVQAGGFDDDVFGNVWK